MKNFNGQHPELKTGEIWIGNFKKKDLPKVKYLTQRVGQKAYDAEGQLILPQGQWRPVFIQSSEMSERRKLMKIKTQKYWSGEKSDESL